VNHARSPLPAALVRTTKRSPDNNRPVDLSRLQKADFVPALGY
jgi:hypothetical protein